ncbi:MAG TPA: serine hydrolase [Gemmatimonadales bacterium]|jgi:Beta-lactamase class C and other penicillin binding proteins
MRLIASVSHVLAALLLAGPLAAQGAPPDFDRYVARVMKTFTVPGLSVAIVKDGRVVLAKGYGVRRLGDPTPVDEHTRFGIASNTKLFTATALELLVEEGKLEWDAPVIRYLPWFAMSDPYVTRELTVRDLLVHRSGLGLGGGDLLWWPSSTYRRDEIARRLRYIPLATSFRSAYAYDNVLYLVAGEVIEAVSGRSWEDFVRGRILEKVGMTESDVLHSGAGRSGNVAATHAEVEGTVRPIAPFLSDNTNPAGGIMSGAADMAKWMMVHLDSGRVTGGARLFKPAAVTHLWREVTPVPISSPPEGVPHLRATMAGYALGLHVRDYRGRRLLQHTGGLPGYVSKVAMVPGLRLGVTVLTNQESGAAFEAIVYQVLDHYLGAKSPDYPAIFDRMVKQNFAEVRAMEGKAAAARDSTSGPSLPLERYAGTYRDPWYGDVVIAREGPGLVLRFAHTPSLVGDLVHWQHDSFFARWRDRELRADAYATFWLDHDGSVARLRLVPSSPLVDFSFDFQDLDLRPVSPESLKAR